MGNDVRHENRAPSCGRAPVTSSNEARHVIIVGAGFAGLSAAYELRTRGYRVTVLERDDHIGGPAGSFQIEGRRLEKFYHHWFNNDVHAMQPIQDLGAQDRLLFRSTRTRVYYADTILQLSTPRDLLNFKARSNAGARILSRTH